MNKINIVCGCAVFSVHVFLTYDCSYFTAVVPLSTSTARPIEEDEGTWEYIFGSPSATLAVIIAIPVVLILVIAIAVIYCINKRKKTSSTVRRRPPHPMLHEHEASMPLNINTNNATYNGGHKLSNGEVFSYADNLYKPTSYQRPMTTQQYSQYSQSDGSYRSAIIYPPPPPLQAPTTYSSQHSYVDIPDTDSHFSSVSHTRPQFMSHSTHHYERDIQSDPAHSRLSHHHCPPPPPSSFYSEQW